MNYRIISIVLYCCLVIAGISLFSVKTLVHNMQSQHAELKKQVAQELSSVTLLKANFSYLSKPDRLRELATKYLDLKTINLTQISQNSNFMKNNISKNLSKFSKLTKTSKWRYKYLKNILTNTVSAEKIHTTKIKKN